MRELHMEHRWYPRTPIDIDALLYRRGKPSASAQIRNLSTDGMLLESKAVEFAQNSVLEVASTAGRKSNIQNYRVSAVVVHGENDRFGV